METTGKLFLLSRIGKENQVGSDVSGPPDRFVVKFIVLLCIWVLLRTQIQVRVPCMHFCFSNVKEVS